MMDWSLSMLPDEVIVNIFRAHDARYDARVVAWAFRHLIEASFEIRHFTPPAGKVFVLDFEINDNMKKNMYCARFGGAPAGLAKGVAGAVTFLNWIPAYFRSVVNAHRDICYELRDQDCCALWKAVLKIRELRSDGGGVLDGPETPNQQNIVTSMLRPHGHLIVSEGEGGVSCSGIQKMGDRKVIGRLSADEADLFLKVLDYRRNSYPRLHREGDAQVAA
jgi:hypothetical protein